MKNKMMLCLTTVLGFSCSDKPAQQPNIVLINIDDLGWTDLSCMGHEGYETPNIDSFRKQGVWFQQAYSTAANSAPSRACMLTGQYSPRHGIYTVANSDRGQAKHRKLIPIKNKTSLKQDIQILPRELKKAGYQTCHIGKWHVSENPLDFGVDVNIGGGHNGHPKTYFSPYKNKNLTDGEKGEYLMDRLSKEAAYYIEKVDKSKPFFLYYATYAVHTPLQGPDKLVKKYKEKKKTNPFLNPKYAAMVEKMDQGVGRVLAALREQNLMDNTLIIFTSDNGGVYHISHQDPLRMGKGSFYEGGIRIPLVLYQKGVFESDEINDIAVSNLDFFPTIMESAGVNPQHLHLDGMSLLPLAKKQKEAFKERSLYWHFPAYLEGSGEECSRSNSPYFRTTPVSVIRKGDWKLIENYETNTIELYNLSIDLSERKECSNKHEDICKNLYQSLKGWKECVKAPIPTKLNPYYKK